jgi:hypothetical protein
VLCGRCSTDVGDPTFLCWWCGAALCPAHGDGLGHCGHPEAEEVIERSAETDVEGHRRIAEALRVFRGNAGRVDEVRSTLRPKPKLRAWPLGGLALRAARRE